MRIMKEIVSTADAPSALGPYSQGVKVGDLLFTAGQIAIDPTTGEMNNATIEDEIHQVMKNLTAVAIAAGTDLSKAVKTTIFITNLADFGTINEIYGSYFTDNPPARSTVGVAGLPKGFKIEIEMIIHL